MGWGDGVYRGLKGSWSRIHEHTISLRFLGILKSSQNEAFVWFSIKFSSFLLTVYGNWTVEIVRGCLSWISRQSGRVDCEYQGGKLSRLLSGFRPRIWPLDGTFFTNGTSSKEPAEKNIRNGEGLLAGTQLPQNPFAGNLMTQRVMDRLR